MKRELKWRPIDVLCALGVIGFLSALAVTAVSRSIENARLQECDFNLKQIGLAMANYESSWDALPPAASRDQYGRALLSWRVPLVPYFDCNDLYNKYHRDEPWNSDANAKLIPLTELAYLCPSDASLTRLRGMTKYRIFTGKGTAFGEDRSPRSDKTPDGAPNTISVVESRLETTWTKPGELVFDPKTPPEKLVKSLGSNHPGGFRVLFLDYHTAFVKNSVDPVILRALLTRDGGEKIDLGAASGVSREGERHDEPNQ